MSVFLPGWRARVTLSGVQLERFKAAFDPDEVELRGFNVIIGRNGTGKSTLLEALQWLDTTIRRDAREACDRYQGVSDLVNLRSQSKTPWFGLRLRWRDDSSGAGAATWRYAVTVVDENGIPRISDEQLDVQEDGQRVRHYLETSGGARVVRPTGRADDPGSYPVREPDRLALTRAAEAGGGDWPSPAALGRFWSHAVFLRLSPNRLAAGSPATRKSFEPLLDEEGQNLPALLNELTDEQRAELVDDIKDVLPGFEELAVSKAEAGRDTRVHYSLMEKMPYRGRAGKKRFPIPAWMLSEGTRRITAILALLVHGTPPSLLCIEEIENGLDPTTTLHVLKRLRAAAARRGVQVVLTTHSPWLLDHVPIESILHVRRQQGDTVYERFADLPEVQAYESGVPAGTRYVDLERQRG